MLTWVRFNSNGTIITPIDNPPHVSYSDNFPSTWLNTTPPADPTIYWFRVIVTAEWYVTGSKTGIYSAWIQMPASGSIEWGNRCVYDPISGAGEADTQWTLEIAIGAGGTPVDNCTGWISGITFGGA